MDPRRLAETVRRHQRLRRWARIAEVAILAGSAAAVARVLFVVVHAHSSL